VVSEISLSLVWLAGSRAQEREIEMERGMCARGRERTSRASVAETGLRLLPTESVAFIVLDSGGQARGVEEERGYGTA